MTWFKAVKVRQVSQLDHIQETWQKSLGTNQINRAAKITRTATELNIVTEEGHTLNFELIETSTKDKGSADGH